MEKDNSQSQVEGRNSEAANSVDYVEYSPPDLFGGQD